MALLKPSPVREDRFTPSGHRELVAEISDFGKGWDFDRVWNDSCDEGLTLVMNDGREIVFVIDNEIQRGGDLLCWILVPVTDYPERDYYKLTIYND